MSKTPTVDQAMTALVRAIGREHERNTEARLRALLNGEAGPGVAHPEAWNVAVAQARAEAKPKRKYRLSAAGRARRIAAVKRFWAAKRKAAKK